MELNECDTNATMPLVTDILRLDRFKSTAGKSIVYAPSIQSLISMLKIMSLTGNSTFIRHEKSCQTQPISK